MHTLRDAGFLRVNTIFFLENCSQVTIKYILRHKAWSWYLISLDFLIFFHKSNIYSISKILHCLTICTIVHQFVKFFFCVCVKCTTFCDCLCSSSCCFPASSVQDFRIINRYPWFWNLLIWWFEGLKFSGFYVRIDVRIGIIISMRHMITKFD